MPELLGPNLFILGAGKTGTTILYYTIKEGAERKFGNYEGIFEPRDLGGLSTHYARPVVIKMLAERYVKGFAFNQLNISAGERRILEISAVGKRVLEIGAAGKRILIIRDPRDTIVSRMLYQSRDFFRSAEKHESVKLSGLVRAKEMEPSSKSVIAIYKEMGEIMNKDFSAHVAAQAAILAIEILTMASNEFFLMHYENLVRGEWDRLEGYLGFSVPRTAEVAPRYARVKRTATYGEWRRWFTQEDVEYFRPILSDALRKGGYADDWDLDNKRRIPASHGSDYVRRLFQLKFESQIR